jgi:hypothetical protein
MTIVESLQSILAEAEKLAGPNAPGVLALRRQLEEITQKQKSRIGGDSIVSWTAGLRGKRKSEKE